MDNSHNPLDADGAQGQTCRHRVTKGAPNPAGRFPSNATMAFCNRPATLHVTNGTDLPRCQTVPGCLARSGRMDGGGPGTLPTKASRYGGEEGAIRDVPGRTGRGCSGG